MKPGMRGTAMRPEPRNLKRVTRTFVPTVLTHLTMKSLPQRLVACSSIACLAALLATSGGAQTLTHRYSFNDSTTGTTFHDSVGGFTWDGSLIGTASLDGSSMQLDGFGGWATLPPGIISNYTSVSVEFWATLSDQNPTWTRVFAFGEQNAGGAQVDGIDYCHYAGGNYQNLNFSTTNTGIYVNNPAGLNGTTNVHVSVVVDPVNNRMFYYNGTTLTSGPVNGNGGVVPPLSTMNDVLNLIGKSLYDVDPPLAGSIDEFRIYSGPMTAAIIALNDAAGPNNYVASPGTLGAIHLSAPDNPLVVNQNSQLGFTGDFSNVTGLNLNAYGGASYLSGNTAVLTVNSSNGLVHAVGPGTTTVTASYGTLNVTRNLTVVTVPAVLAHRYSFTSDASDSIGGANGTLMGTAAVSGGKVVLDGNGGTYVDLPGSIINIATNRSVTLEAWVDFGTIPQWCRLFDFGADGGSSEIYLAPSGPGNGGEHRSVSENFAGGRTIDWKGAWTNISAHITVVVDPLTFTLAMYRDGVLEFARYDATAPLTVISTDLAVLGRSLVGVDPYMPGAIDEFRIYSGALSAQEIAMTQKNGPNSTSHDPGTLNSIKVPATAYPAYSSLVPPVVLANYANLTNFNLLPNNSASMNGLVIVSSDSSVIRVLPNNMLSTGRPGTATLTATYLGKTDSATVTVQNIATLTHRYSFTNDTSDSVGHADGTLQGSASVSGGNLALDGNPGSYVELPPGLLEGYDAATIDTWVTFNAAQTWARLWFFGDDRADEFYIAPSVNGGGAHRFSTGITFGGPNVDTSPRWENQTLHITGIFGNGQFEIYTNGMAETALSGLTGRLAEVGNWFSWIGRSPYNDPFVNANIDEFRIYRGRLAPDEIQALDVIGPNALPISNPSLSVSAGSGNVTLKWPVAAAGFSVQGKPTINGNWTTLTNQPVLSNNQWQVTLPTSGSAQFFRLWR
jgi:hypothetical protein